MRRWISVVLVVWVAVSLQAQELDALVERAKFIFVGEVVKLGSSNLPSVAPSASTAVVRVRKVLTGEALLGGFAGREITVTMQQPSRLADAVFFTNVVVYGDTLAAEEVAPASAGEVPDIAAAQRRNAERALEAKKARAAVIVTGRVIEVRPLQTRPMTEHDPLWAVAVVQVGKVLKGSAGPTVEILFAASHDEMWRKSPKFAVGDTGTFILVRGERGLTAL